MSKNVFDMYDLPSIYWLINFNEVITDNYHYHNDKNHIKDMEISAGLFYIF